MIQRQNLALSPAGPTGPLVSCINSQPHYNHVPINRQAGLTESELSSLLHALKTGFDHRT